MVDTQLRLQVPCTWGGLTCDTDARYLSIRIRFFPLNGTLQGDWDVISPWVRRLFLDGLTLEVCGPLQGCMMLLS